MLRRWHVLLLILVTLAAFCGLAAAKLRATPKYDRIRVGMLFEQVEAELGQSGDYVNAEKTMLCAWECDEGRIHLFFDHGIVESESINRRGPLERLAWLAGWQGTGPIE